jgi:hypothetical protein
MVLVLLVIGIAFIMGLTFLTNATTTTGVALLMQHHAQARQTAESGILLALRSIEETPEWRATRSPGIWIDGMSLLGGTVEITADFTPEAGPQLVNVEDESFEQELAELPTPPTDPPMSGQIGGWEVQRDAAIITGPTVPRVAVVPTPDAPDGGNCALIGFDVAIDGSAVFGQTLTSDLEPRRNYTLRVDIALTAILPLEEGYGFRLLAGGSVVASTEQAVTLEELMSEPDAEAWVEYIDGGDGFLEHALHFLTGADPPTGPLRVELFAESSGLLMEVAFDNVRLEMRSNEPLVLTSVGRSGEASHVTTVRVISALDGSGEIVEWEER